MVARFAKPVPLAAVLMLFFMGCGGEPDTIGRTLTVSGTVKIDGKDLEEGAIVFAPDDKKGNKAKVGVQGTIKGGAYTLSSTPTSGPSKSGAPPGWYKAIINTNAPMGGMTAVESPDKGGGAGMPKIGEKKGTPIAKKYTTFEETPLSVEVKDGGNYNLEATSK
jgi:hypothetical protein